MKSLIFVAVLVVVCGQSAVNVQADVIECEFKDVSQYGYTCDIKSIQQDENQNVITGKHETGKSDSDVKTVGYVLLVSIKLTNFDSIFCQKFPNLEIINFFFLKPANLIENALRGCSSLKQFLLEDADIKKIPENLFANNLKLTGIGLGGNRLETLPQNIFQPLTELIFLWLYNNNLSTLSPGLFDNLRNLQDLSLSGNRIKDLPKNIFVGLKMLSLLWLNSNNLLTIHGDSFGRKLQLSEVYLQDNQITSIDEMFIDNSAVEWIDMGGNICSQELITSRDEIKEKLQKCFENYQPRQQQNKLLLL